MSIGARVLTRIEKITIPNKRRLVQHEGMKGLYRGYTAGLLGTIHGGVQFYVLEDFVTLL